MHFFTRLFGRRAPAQLDANDKIICWNRLDNVWEHTFSECTDLEVEYLLGACELEVGYTRDSLQTFIDGEVPRVMKWVAVQSRFYDKRVKAHKQIVDMERKLREAAQERAISRIGVRLDSHQIVEDLQDRLMLKHLNAPSSKSYLYIKSGKRLLEPERLDSISEERARSLVVAKLALYLAYFGARSFSDALADVRKILEGGSLT